MTQYDQGGHFWCRTRLFDNEDRLNGEKRLVLLFGNIGLKRSADTLNSLVLVLIHQIQLTILLNRTKKVNGILGGEAYFSNLTSNLT